MSEYPKGVHNLVKNDPKNVGHPKKMWEKLRSRLWELSQAITIIPLITCLTRTSSPHRLCQSLDWGEDDAWDSASDPAIPPLSCKSMGLYTLGLPPRPILDGWTATVAGDGLPSRQASEQHLGRHGYNTGALPSQTVPYTAVDGCSMK
ncbi:hypothetical protein JOM56_011165 [Amanita muscaria]